MNCGTNSNSFKVYEHFPNISVKGRNHNNTIKTLAFKIKFLVLMANAQMKCAAHILLTEVPMNGVVINVNVVFHHLFNLWITFESRTRNKITNPNGKNKMWIKN